MPSGLGARERLAAPEAELADRAQARPAVVGEVVERGDDRGAGEERIARGVRPGPLEERGAGVPVVDVEDVERAAVAPQGRERRAAEDGEPPRVVGVVVERVAVEGGGDVDEAQPVAVRGDVDDRDVERRARGARGPGRGS